MNRLILFVFLFPCMLKAAPHPATATSVITNPSSEAFFKGFGFKLSDPQKQWQPIATYNETLLESFRFEKKEGLPQSKSHKN